MIRFLLDHPWYSYALTLSAFVILWLVFVAWLGESDEQRDARRRREAKARTDKMIRAIKAEHVEREKERVGRLIEERADRVVAKATSIVSKLDTPQRAREAEGLDEEWTAAADGKRVA